MPSWLRRLLFGGAFLGGLALFTILAYSIATQPSQPAVDPSVLAPSTPLSSPSVQVIKPGNTLTASPSESTTPTPRCSTASRPFTPEEVAIKNITSGTTVLGVPRDAGGTPETPPLTDTGKQQLAWDEPGAKPGSPQGNVLFNAHTWPDGSALGNRLLKQLEPGAVIVVKGSDGQRLCYQVTERMEVPVAQYPQQRVYDTAAKPHLIITVCSGLRLGPGDWANRTLWFAVPMK